MTGGKLEIAYLFIGLAATAIMFILCGIIVFKTVNLYRQRSRLKCEVDNQAYFERIQIGLDKDDAFPTPEGKLSDLEKSVVQAKLMAWIERVDGLSRDKLISLCEELGFVEQELVSLQSRFSIRRTKAAY